MKDFSSWFKLKEKIDGFVHRAPYVSEGDIWWASLGENVGSEISGKHELFSRPIVVLKKLAHGFYLVIPTTTKEKEGTWYIPFSHREKHMRACLHQARTVDHRRLSSKLGSLDSVDLNRIREGFWQLYK